MNTAKDKMQLCKDGLVELYNTEPEDLHATLLGLHQLADEALVALEEQPKSCFGSFDRDRNICKMCADRNDCMSKPERPSVVTLCGSTRFMEAFFEAGWELTLRGFIVLSVGVCKHTEHHGAEALGVDVADKLDELHLRKIDLSEWILVLDVNNYVGESTQKEIDYAEKTGKKIVYLSECDWFTAMYERLSCQSKPEPSAPDKLKSGELVKELRDAAFGHTSFAGRDQDGELPRTCETPMCKLLNKTAAYIERLENEKRQFDKTLNHVRSARNTAFDLYAKAEADIALRPAKPLEGEARSLILKAMDNSADIDIAIEKWVNLKAANKAQAERIADLEKKGE